MFEWKYRIPDWTDESLYHNKASLRQWYWEFLRRNNEYQEAWKIAFERWLKSKVEFEAEMLKNLVGQAPKERTLVKWHTLAEESILEEREWEKPSFEIPFTNETNENSIYHQFGLISGEGLLNPNCNFPKTLPSVSTVKCRAQHVLDENLVFDRGFYKDRAKLGLGFFQFDLNISNEANMNIFKECLQGERTKGVQDAKKFRDDAIENLSRIQNKLKKLKALTLQDAQNMSVGQGRELISIEAKGLPFEEAKAMGIKDLERRKQQAEKRLREDRENLNNSKKRKNIKQRKKTILDNMDFKNCLRIFDAKMKRYEDNTKILETLGLKRYKSKTDNKDLVNDKFKQANAVIKNKKYMLLPFTNNKAIS